MLEAGSLVAVRFPKTGGWIFAPRGGEPHHWRALHTHAGSIAWEAFEGNAHSWMRPPRYRESVVLQVSATILGEAVRDAPSALPVAAYALGDIVMATEIQVPEQPAEDEAVSVLFGIGKGKLCAQLGIMDLDNRTFQQVPNVTASENQASMTVMLEQFPNAQRV